jgi:RNA polymerase sigma-70 factor (ECF subfamily)
MSPTADLLVDDRLMMQVQAGSAEAFRELYDLYCDRAYRVAWSVCHDQGRAEDAVQEAFVSIWSARASYSRRRGSVAAWLLTVTRYRAIDVARRDHKHSARQIGEQVLEAQSTPGDVGEQAVTRDEAHRLREVLAQLPDAQREVITLAFYGELSHTEIAIALKLPAGTVKGRMRLGIRKLRMSIEREVA